MQKGKSIKKNYIYNVIYQAFLVIVPLIVTPYISRVLLPYGVGQYSFAMSLITYFTIFAALGFGIYAQREIAKNQGDLEKQSKAFWEINICRLISVGLAMLINIVLCVFSLYGDYNELMWIFNINIIAIAFDIAFYFQGNEEFGKLVLRNVLIKIISIVLIFLLVKNPNDLWIYALINSAMLVVSNLSMWLCLGKMLKRVAIKSLQPFKHLKGTIKLFIPTIATSIYTVLDKTLIGVLITDTYVVIEDGIEVVKKYSDLENGYYEQIEKLVKMAMTIITCFGTVMTPRNSSEIAKGNIENVKNNIYTSSKLVWLIGVPMVLTFIACSHNLVPWFYGDGYDKCIVLLMIFSSLIVIIGFSNIFGLQYMVPAGMDKRFSIALISGAIINLVLNCILIPFYWSYGAAIASIIAEICVTVIMGIMIRKVISLKKILLFSIKYLIAGAALFGVAYYISTLLTPSIINTLIIAGSGIIVYFIVLLILREEMIYKLIRKIVKK